MRATRLPKLTTPERASFEAYRQRRQQQSTGKREKAQPPPLGSDPVEGDPVDLRALYDESQMGPSTDEERLAAEVDFNAMLRDSDELPPNFGEGLDDLA